METKITLNGLELILSRRYTPDIISSLPNGERYEMVYEGVTYVQIITPVAQPSGEYPPEINIIGDVYVYAGLRDGMPVYTKKGYMIYHDRLPYKQDGGYVGWFCESLKEARSFCEADGHYTLVGATRLDDAC